MENTDKNFYHNSTNLSSFSKFQDVVAEDGGKVIESEDVLLAAEQEE